MAQLSQLDNNIQQGEEQLKKLRAQRDVSNLFLKMNDSSCNEIMVFCCQGYHYQMLSSPGFFNCADGGETKISISRENDKFSCKTGENQVCFYSQEEMEQLTKDCTWENNCCEISSKCVKVAPAWGFTPIDNSKTVSVADLSQQNNMQSQGTPQMQSQGTPQPSVGTQ